MKEQAASKRGRKQRIIITCISTDKKTTGDDYASHNSHTHDKTTCKSKSDEDTRRGSIIRHIKKKTNHNTNKKNNNNVKKNKHEEHQTY